MSRSISLSQGRVALIDDADYPALSQFKWHYSSQGYALRTVRKSKVAMHRQILGAQPGQLVDHIDGDRLNNTRANLRLVTPTQNQHNRKRNTHSTSGYKGVTRFRNRWQARIRVEGERIHLGYYETPQQAAAVYDAAARHFFGHYARTNAPKNEGTSPAVERLLHDVLQGNPPDRVSRPRRSPVPKAVSPYRGICWERGRWRASLVIAGKKQHLGYFLDEIEAARAYDAAAKANRGAAARLNFPATD